MNKKTLGIILVVLIVAIAGMIYFGLEKGFFTGKGIGIGGIGKKSIMDAAREQGQIVPSKTDAVKECGKETDQGEKDTCYGILAFYYRDASFCKWVKDAEIKKNCNSENIEKWYSEVGKGGAASPFMPGGAIPGGGMLPGGGIIPSGGAGGGAESGGGIENAEPESIPSDASSQLGPTVEPGGKMTDEIYIEILAQSSIAAGDLNTYASRIKALYDKYGVTADDIKAYASELEKDPQRAALIGQRYMQRAMELRGMGQ